MAFLTSSRISSGARMSRKTEEDDRRSPLDQLTTSAAPTIPMKGSSQFSPKYFPPKSATMASTEVMASAAHGGRRTRDYGPYEGNGERGVRDGAHALLALGAVSVPAVGVLTSAQDEQADTVNDQSQNGDEERLVEPIGKRGDQALNAFPDHDDAKRPSMTALAKAARELTLPVPKLNRGS